MSGLRVGRAAVLGAAVRVARGDEADLAVRLAVAGRVAAAGAVDSVAVGERVQERPVARVAGAGDRALAEGAERDDVAVELAGPVVETVDGRVRDQDVAAGAAVGEVGVRWKAVDERPPRKPMLGLVSALRDGELASGNCGIQPALLLHNRSYKRALLFDAVVE